MEKENGKNSKMKEKPFLSIYEKKGLQKVTLTKNSQGSYEVNGLIYQYHRVRNYHYFNCQWNRRTQEGGGCAGKLAVKEFNADTLSSGDAVEVHLVNNHSEGCPTLLSLKNDPEVKKKELLTQAEIYRESKKRITDYIEKFPEKSPAEVITWMRESFEIHLQLQDSQVRDLVYNYRRLWMISQESYAKTYVNNSEGLPFLRANLTLKIKKGNMDREYRIWIWSSEFQLSRLRLTNHFFIDGTFGIVPTGYSQLVNIAIIDKSTEDVIPICWILTNSKDYQCYKYVLYHFRELVTRSNRIKWSLDYVTVDFEEVLMKAITDNFPETRIIGCLFHLKQALWRTANNLGIKSNVEIDKSKQLTKTELTSTLIDILSKYSWQSQKDIETLKKGLQELKTSFVKYPDHIKLIDYYQKNWLSYLVEGTIYYGDLVDNLDRIRANSVLEKYHAELKSNMPSNPKWEKLISFLVQKEKNLVEILTIKMKQGLIRQKSQWGKKYFPAKSVKYKKANFLNNYEDESESDENYRDSNVNSEEVKLQEFNYDEIKTNDQLADYHENNKLLTFDWISWDRSSCRYDSFLTVFCCSLYGHDKELLSNEIFIKQCNYTESYNYLIKTSNEITRGNYNARFDFWDFLNQPIHSSQSSLTKIRLDNEGIGNYGSVSVLLPLLNASSLMDLFVIVGSRCINKNCKLQKMERKILKVPIVIEHIYSNSIQGCLDEYFSSNEYLVCEKWFNQKKTQNYLLFNNPAYLTIYFETHEKIFQKFTVNEQIFLKVVSQSYSQVPSTFVEYQLIAMINSPSPVHFNCSLLNPMIRNQVYEGWFLHDGLKEDGKIIITTFKKLIQQKPFVFFYKRKD